MENLTLKIYKTDYRVETPKFQTQGSACFDLMFSCFGKTSYMGYNEQNAQFNRQFHTINGIPSILIMSGDRILIPTGLIFDIPENYSVRIHPRSGLSLKKGLVLANMEGVVDSDYVEETYVMLHNISKNKLTISNGERIAQAELVRNEKYELVDIQEKPTQKTDRNGGFGSTDENKENTINTSDKSKKLKIKITQ